MTCARQPAGVRQRMDQFPPMPSNGQCVCGRVPFFVRSGVIGQPGHFHCRRCGRRYSFSEPPRAPGQGESVGSSEESGGRVG